MSKPQPVEILTQPSWALVLEPQRPPRPGPVPSPLAARRERAHRTCCRLGLDRAPSSKTLPREWKRVGEGLPRVLSPGRNELCQGVRCSSESQKSQPHVLSRAVPSEHRDGLDRSHLLPTVISLDLL